MHIFSLRQISFCVVLRCEIYLDVHRCDSPLRPVSDIELYLLRLVAINIAIAFNGFRTSNFTDILPILLFHKKNDFFSEQTLKVIAKPYKMKPFQIGYVFSRCAFAAFDVINYEKLKKK